MQTTSASSSPRLSPWRRTYLILLALFAISVLLRIPNFDRPLGGYHQWLSAHILITIDIWNEHGISTYGYNPIYSFQNPNDKHIRYLPSGIPDSEGNFYYISYPPFTFLLPYFTFKLLGITPDIVPLQFLNMLLHLIGAFFTYLIVCRLYRRDPKDGLFIPALIAFMVYTFTSTALWYHANTFFSDMVVQPMWVIAIYLSLRLFDPKGKGVLRRRHIVAVGFLVFLMVFTEWLGVFFAAMAGLFTLIFFKRNPKGYSYLLGSIVLGVAAGIGLTIFQYSHIDGLDNFIQAQVDRFMLRAGHASNTPGVNNPLFHMYLWRKMYGWVYYPHIIAMAFGSILLLFLPKKRKLGLSRKEVVFMVLATVPILLHHFVFFQFTLFHEFALLKSLLFISVVLGMFTYRLSESIREDYALTSRILNFTMITCMMGLSVSFYYDHYQPTEKNLQHIQLAKTMKEHVLPDETVFVIPEPQKTQIIYIPDEGDAERSFVAPQMLYYLDRSVLGVKNKEEARQHLVQYGKQKGILFEVDMNLQVQNILRISLDDVYSTASIP